MHSWSFFQSSSFACIICGVCQSLFMRSRSSNIASGNTTASNAASKKTKKKKDIKPDMVRFQFEKFLAKGFNFLQSFQRTPFKGHIGLFLSKLRINWLPMIAKDRLTGPLKFTRTNFSWFSFLFFQIFHSKKLQRALLF